MSEPVKDGGYMPLGEGRCMCVQTVAGDRCTAPGRYVADLDTDDGRRVVDALWCVAHAAAIRAEHPEQIVQIRSWWPRAPDRRRGSGALQPD